MEGEILFDRICSTLFESAAEGLVVTNHAGTMVLVNSRMEDLFGYKREEMLGESVNILIPTEAVKRHQKHLNDYIDQPTRRSMGIGFDLLAQRKDGSHFPVEVSLNHFSIDGRQHVMALVTDITARKKAEQALAEMNEELERRVQSRTRELRESQQLYAVIARNFPNGSINVFDRDLNYIFAEGRELFRLGVTSEHIMGTKYLDRLPEQVRGQVAEELKLALQGQSVTFDLDLEGKSYELHAVPLRDAEGVVARVMVVENNITQQRRAAGDILKALEKERQLNELKSRFVAMASHEFRTPLSTILSSISLLMRYSAPEHEENRIKHYNRIRNSVHSLTAILNDFLSLDKLESGRITPTLEDFDLEALIVDMIDELQLITKAGQTMLLDYKGETKVRLDKNMTRNICLNLISNAIKYSPEGKEVSIAVEVAAEKIRMEVRDQGIGIPESDKQHMFERFFRAQNATNIQGTGLGLTIVKKYLDLMGGDIWFDSEVGKGSVFTIVLPQRLSS
ncbi:MAG: PAS domain S-box protein [Bacteroidia bacterium]